MKCICLILIFVEMIPFIKVGFRLKGNLLKIVTTMILYLSYRFHVSDFLHSLHPYLT